MAWCVVYVVIYELFYVRRCLYAINESEANELIIQALESINLSKHIVQMLAFIFFIQFAAV